MEYLGPVWPADVWPADDIPFCSIFTYFQYSLIHDLALNILLLFYFLIGKKYTFFSESECYSKSTTI